MFALFYSQSEEFDLPLFCSQQEGIAMPAKQRRAGLAPELPAPEEEPSNTATRSQAPVDVRQLLAVAKVGPQIAENEILGTPLTSHSRVSLLGQRVQDLFSNPVSDTRDQLGVNVEQVNATSNNGNERPPLASDMFPLSVGIPDVERWDRLLLKGYAYSSGVDTAKLDDLILHPTSTLGYSVVSAATLKLMKTKEEIRRERHNNRVEQQRQRLERQKLGLEAPEGEKLRFRNLRDRLFVDAVLNPTEQETAIAEAADRRIETHYENNFQRHLAAREAQILKKIADRRSDASSNPVVAVFRITKTNDRHLLGKVQLNAKERLLRAKILWIMKEECVILLWGGARPIRRLDRLILQSIQWPEGSTAQCCFFAHSEPAHIPRVFLDEDEVNVVHSVDEADAQKLQHRAHLLEFQSREDALAFCHSHDCAHWWDAAMRCGPHL